MHYEVTAPSELTNSITERQLVFRGGNCIDVELQTDPAADPGRKEAGIGDMRLIITRQEGRPLCVGFKKKVAGFKGRAVVE